MTTFSLRSLLLAAIVLSNCISWTTSRHHYTHNVSGHRSRHRRTQGAGLFLSASYVLPGGDGAGWGDWGEVSPCSRTCGGGVASQKRICLQIGPDGVPQCTGGNTKYFSCGTQDCPAGSQDFREQQCSEYDDKLFNGIKYRWVPYTQGPNPCELNCMPHGERFYYRHAQKVADGTRCNDESFDVCVDGTCQPVGCDLMLGSNAREDECRDCRGNGTNCHTTTGLLDNPDLMKGYNDLLLIPEGATNIAIAERGPSRNYLALRSRNNSYYLNGGYQIDFPRSLTIAGALWYYERSQQGFAAPDKLRCLGPTNEPLILALLLQDENVGIEYKYSVPNNRAPSTDKQYNWAHGEFSPCNATCGGGHQTREVTCRSREELELVDEALCDIDLKPATNQTCNTSPCPAQWSPGPWGECSKRCGEGGIRSREVHCTQIISNGLSSIVGEKSCIEVFGSKPEQHQTCNENATCPIWFTGPWKPCDKLCGEGKQARQVLCYQKNGSRKEILSDKECEEDKPPTEQTCMLQPCEGVDWVVTAWRGCDSCLSTVRTRTAVCATKTYSVVNDSFCSYHAAPSLQEACDRTKLPPCDVQWYATQWSNCSVDCGKGIQSRKVFCGLFDGASVLKVDDSRCSALPKYNETKECEVPQDKCPSQWFTAPWIACTKKCGGGEQFRRVMCLRGGSPATDCLEHLIPSREQACNTQPCDKVDELKAESPLLEDDYDDCVEGDEEDDFREVGLDSDDKYTADDLMFSDTTVSEGSGLWTSSTAEHESTFETEPTLSSDELFEANEKTSTIDFDLGSGSGDYSTTTDNGSSTTYSTDSTSTDTGSTSGTGSTETSEADTGSTNAEKTTVSGETDTGSDDTSSTDITSSTVSGSTDYEETDEPTKASGETSETDTTGSEGSTLSSASESTDISEPSTVSGSEPTDLSSSTVSEGSTESVATSETPESESTVTTESGATDETPIETTANTDETSESITTEIDETITTETSITESTETTETSETDSTTVIDTSSTNVETTETSETSESTSTESSVSTETTESSSTDATETSELSTTESAISSSTETTEETATTESTETTEADKSTTEAKTGTTESTETTEQSSTVSTETTEQSSTISTETTEEGSTVSTETTEEGSTVSTETTAEGSTVSTETTAEGSTVSTETTAEGSTVSTETTGSDTEPTETTETDTTEVSASTETSLSTETTEVSGSTGIETTELTGTTESTETTELESTISTDTAETEITETTEAFTGSTESTVEEGSGSTATTEEGSTSSSEETETTEESTTTESSSSGTTRWDLSTTVEVYTTTKKRTCRPRSCTRSEFGCCPDNKTPALGPFDEGCPKPETCKESPYGCCPDGLSPALGPVDQGCPLEPCAETFFGCCKTDNKTAAEGNDDEGCPPPPPACLFSKYGCCKDETEAKGPAKEGCPETSTTVEVDTDTEESSTTSEDIESTTPSEISTKPDRGCHDTEFGCCFDGATAAAGPDLQGCPCHASEFGCCPDGVSTAEGADFEGCVKSCNTSAFGCCPDGKTPAHGPEQEGCCLLYPYGCCPDNYKPADGPHLEGCGCQSSRFGCCPDNVTVATGPDNKGCGCQYSEHGCCPDRHTEATGPEFEGCMCHTYQFGCCPDGITVAGPNGHGCYCQQSQFRCCGDEQTYAKGPNKLGCDCSNSKHGCCLDGVTEATGPKFEGCTEKPLDKQAACGLKFERGPCRNYSVGWFYDTEYGGCSRFWYGGCEGNGNRFSSKEECEDTCVSPPAREVCRLPQIKGVCGGYNQRWYYDTEREMCSNFIYGGCLGNDNNFETRELCQARCEPERAADQCSLTIERGSCAGNYLRWGYNKDAKTCEQFVWGGCEGNTNRFSSEAACMLRCNPPGKPQPECSKAQDVGNGTDTEAKWSFSQTENRCVPFYYTGSGGNDNQYTSREGCEMACPSAFVPELCSLPASTGECYDYREKWYFDTKLQRCNMFYYGGCGGNENRFDSEPECVNRCSPPTSTPVPTVTTVATQATLSGSEFCFMEIDAGPCNRMELKWGYDYKRGKCVSFQFGGCGGNDNNFPSEEHCTYFCKPTQDICQLPMLSGPCDESVMRWFYDSSSDSCSQFAYGGCDGNDNRFETREECENRCKSGPARPTVSTTTVQPSTMIDDNLPPECTVPSELEQCSPGTVGEVWFYDRETSACKAHGNSDTGVECRTTNVFYSQEACERACGFFRGIDVCQYDKEPGPCREYRPKYYYNKNASRCEEFAYGGCFGGANRFSTEQECQQICMTAIDPCTLPAEPGNCVGHMVMWYFNQDVAECYQFVYGGCGGNENKFESREACEGQCKRQRPPVTTTTLAPATQTTRQYQPEPEGECRTPQSLAPCGTNETVFYFDEASSSCRAADIGGCGSSMNLYRSEEECERRCGAFRGIDVCRVGLDPGPCRAAFPKFYFEVTSGRCREFTYGGCQGGANRFSTVEECEEICSNVGPARECLEPVAIGDRCAEVPERRWHYDVSRADCLVFSYQGCNGNENNFRSYDECASVCRLTRPEPSDPCSAFSEECSSLETTCVYGLKISLTPDSCTRCECKESPNCDEQRLECDTLQCRYGVEKSATPDGCEKCKCFESPCSRMPCASTERCVAVPTRNPDTQEIVYQAQCESNEIEDCEAYIAECASIRTQCPYGVQRRRVGRCERCTCVDVETNCEPLQLECERLKCRYGLNRTTFDDGCVRCKCLPPPCNAKTCPEGQRCVAAPFRDPVTQESRYTANCLIVNKPGVCPAPEEAISRSTETACRQECRDDADCRGVLKCCARGCGQLCLAPEPPTTPQPSTTHTPDLPRAPEANTDPSLGRPQVDASEGGKATLRCYFHGNPPPKITWRFGEVTIDGDAGRYRLLSDGALEIISVYRNDSGVYICVAQNDQGSARQQVTLTVTDPVETPAAIAGPEGPLTGELGRELVVRCQAYGYPTPAIYWYRGHGGEMVPYSDALFEARGQDLLIRKLTIDTLGEYECQAYNGQGRAATWRVRVQAFRPDGDTRRNPYLVEQSVNVTPRRPVPTQPAPPVIITTEQPSFVVPPYSVPVQTSLPPTSSVSVGGQLSLPCEVYGFPEPQVSWSKDGVPLVYSERVWTTGSRLTIERAEVSDGGVYSCHAANAYSAHSSAVRVTVQEVSIPVSCVDNPTFANCALIVQSRFCVHKYYSKFCCKSCVEAGQLDPQEVLMQADQSYFRK